MIREVVKFAISLMLFFVLASVQASFFPYFAIAGAVPNLVFALFFTLIFFEPKRQVGTGFFAVAAAGILQDMVLGSYFGICTACLLAVYGLRKAIAYFLKEADGQYVAFNGMGTFAACFLLYQVLLYGFSMIIDIQAPINMQTLVSLVYTLLFALVGFFIYKNLFREKAEVNQLKLF